MWRRDLGDEDAFAGARCFGLMAHSLVDVAPDLNDARSLPWVLLGEGTGREVEGHGRAYLRTAQHLQHKDVMIARGVLVPGAR